MAYEGKVLKKLTIPSFPSDDEKGHYEVNTIEEKIVCEYTGYDFDRVEDLGAFEFWLLLRDAVIYRHSQSEEGISYLDKCWTLTQTEPQRKKLRDKFGKATP